jgi:hypothetical protein
MKQTLKIFALLLAVSSIVMIQSCKEDEPTPAGPTVTAPTSVASVQVGTKADVTFTFTAPGSFKSSSVTATGGTATIKTAPTANATEGNVVVEFTAGATAGAGSVVLTLTDNSNQTATATAVLNVSISAPPSLTLSATTGSGNPGTTVAVTATITAANGASNLTITGATSTPVSPITLTGTAPTQAVTLAIPANAVVNSTILVVFTVKDAQNLVSSPVTYTITVSDPTNILQGNLTTQTLDATKPYLLKGQVFIPNGVTLTVPAGTVIKGDKATKATLVVQPGGKLIANGTANSPVVFTSAQGVGERDRGDWGGIVMLGNAFVNQASKPAVEGITPTQTYGSSIAEAANPSTNATENSGTLTYVRIEYAGIELTPNNETNSLTMGGVGNGTTVSYVQVSFGGDDGFEWFGGTVNGKYLVSHSTWDDDFDTDFGWGGNVQYGLIVRNISAADQSGSNAFESDNQANGATIAGICDGTTNTGCTRGIFSNITVLGPRVVVNTPNVSSNYQNAMHIRRRSAISVFNSFFSGFRVGLRIDDQGTLDNLTSGAGKHGYNVLTVPGTTIIGTSTTAADAVFATGLTISPDPAGNATAISNYWTANNNTSINDITTTIAKITDLGIVSSLYWSDKTSSTYPSNPNFALVAGVAGVNNLNAGANYSDAKFTGNAFFNTAGAHRGAFGATDWTDGWSEFQPINKVY